MFTENPLSAVKPDIDLRRVQWAAKVKIKDGYICTECGGSDRELLDAHHIEPVSVSPNKQYDVENGQTLCLLDHARKHKGKAQILILLRLLTVLMKRL